MLLSIFLFELSRLSVACHSCFQEFSNGAKTEFKWKKTIKRTLKEEGGEMKVKKLRKAVIGKYLEGKREEEDGTHLREVFDEKLSSAGVVVDGKLARL